MNSNQIDDYRIVEVSAINRNTVIRFANWAFIWEFFEPGREIAAETQFMAKRSLISTRYWALIDREDKIIGVTGICEVEKEDPKNCYLGFFILDKSLRGTGIGKRLLDFTEEQARLAGKQKMRVLTSTFIPYRGGRTLYTRNGYKIIATKNRDLVWRVRRSAVIPESVRKAITDQYNLYLKLGLTSTFRKKKGWFLPRPINRMLIFEKKLYPTVTCVR